MNNADSGCVPVCAPKVDFTAINLQTIYTLCIDRFEALDVRLRSVPVSAQEQEDVEAERRGSRGNHEADQLISAVPFVRWSGQKSVELIRPGFSPKTPKTPQFLAPDELIEN